MTIGAAGVVAADAFASALPLASPDPDSAVAAEAASPSAASEIVWNGAGDGDEGERPSMLFCLLEEREKRGCGGGVCHDDPRERAASSSNRLRRSATLTEPL